MVVADTAVDHSTPGVVRHRGTTWQARDVTRSTAAFRGTAAFHGWNGGHAGYFTSRATLAEWALNSGA
jgi:hypothetical protein